MSSLQDVFNDKKQDYIEVYKFDKITVHPNRVVIVFEHNTEKFLVTYHFESKKYTLIHDRIQPANIEIGEDIEEFTRWFSKVEGYVNYCIMYHAIANGLGDY